MKRLQRRVCEYYGIGMDEMLSDRRARCVTRPRQVAMYLAAKMMRFSLPQIGQRFGRDHTTVMHAIKQVERRIAEDDETKIAVQELTLTLTDILADNGCLRLVVSIESIDAARISMTRRLGLVYAQIEAEARRDPLGLLEKLEPAMRELREAGE